MEGYYKAKDATSASKAAADTLEVLKLAESLKKPDEVIIPPQVTTELLPPSNSVSKQVAPPSTASKPQAASKQTSGVTVVIPHGASRTAAAASLPVHPPSGSITACEYIDLLDKSKRGEHLSDVEMENAVYAQILSHQANILAEHPTYRPWKSDIHLANIIASKRTTGSGTGSAGKCTCPSLMFQLYHC